MQLEGQQITKHAALQLLSELEASTEQWTTIYLTPQSAQPRISRLYSEQTTDPRVVEIAGIIEDEGVQRALERFYTGLVLFHSPSSAHALVPPLAIHDDAATRGPANTLPLRRMLEATYRTAVVLVTWGAYILALYEGSDMLVYRKGTGHIHKHHKKGGSSQARFQRRTEEQRKEFLKRAGTRIDEYLGGQKVDHLFFGGNRLILRPLRSQSRFMDQHADITSVRTLQAKRGDREALEAAVYEAYSSMHFQPVNDVPEDADGPRD